MKRLLLGLAVAALLFPAGSALAATPIRIALAPDVGNPAVPRMGDHLHFRSVIRNAGADPLRGLVAWISMVRIDPGHEQPMDLEDWSAHKAVTQARLAPGGQVAVDWPMRLIQPGDYRVVISAVTRDARRITTSPFVDFHVRPKPVVESARVLPVALGIPLLVGGLFLWRVRWRLRKG